MTVKVETYYNISEKGAQLAEIYRKHGDKAVFIVPGSLDKDLLARMVSKDGSFFGRRPAVWTWSDLYREVARGAGAEYLRVIDPPDHHLIINFVLKNYLRDSEEAGKLPPGVTRRGFSSVLGDNLRELMNEEVSPDDMRGLLDINGDSAYAPEAILCDLYDGYLAYLEKHKIADSAQIPTLTRKVLETDAGQSFIADRVIVFVGFLTFTGGQRRLIEIVRSAAKECWGMLPETGIDDYYDGIRQLGADYRERPKWSVNIHRILASGEHTQFEALARELALWLAKSGDLGDLGELNNYGEIGVLVDPRSLRTLQNALTRYNIPYSAQVRENAGDTLAWQLLHEVWEAWIAGFPPGRTLAMMTNPLLDSGYSVAEYSANLPEGREAWCARLSGRALERFESAAKLCLALEQGGAPAEVMTLWRDFLNGLELGDTLAAIAGDEISLDPVIRDMLAVLRELDKKIEILLDLKRDIGEAAGVKLTGTEAVAYLVDWGRSAKLPISLPQSRSVTVYAGIPPVLSMHKYWVMTGIDYNSWPGTLRESPLLRDAAKKILNGGEMDEGGTEVTDRPHMPEIHEQRQQKEALFRRLLATASHGVILTRSVTDQSGRSTGESQFTEALFDTKKSDRDRSYNNLGKTEYPASRMLPRRGDPWFPGAEALSWTEKLDRGDFPRSIKYIAEREKIQVSLSSLDEWNRCPFLYLCRRGARLETPSREVYDRRRSGNMMHRLWEYCWRERLEKDISISQLVVVHWESAVRQEYHELVTDHRLHRHERDLYRRAMALAETQDAIEDRMLERTAVEVEYQLPEYEIEGVIFRGRADRIDFFDDGVVILDYKPGESASYKKSLQLAAYAAVLRERQGLATYGFGWFGLKDSSVSGFWADDLLRVYRPNAKKTAGFESKVDEAMEVMHRMALSLREGVYKANYAHTECNRCDFFTLCRRKEYPLYLLEEEDGEEVGNE